MAGRVIPFPTSPSQPVEISRFVLSQRVSLPGDLHFTGDMKQAHISRPAGLELACGITSALGFEVAAGVGFYLLRQLWRLMH